MLYLFHGEIVNPVWFMRWCEHLGWQVLQKITFTPANVALGKVTDGKAHFTNSGIHEIPPSKLLKLNFSGKNRWKGEKGMECTSMQGV